MAKRKHNQFAATVKHECEAQAVTAKWRGQRMQADGKAQALAIRRDGEARAATAKAMARQVRQKIVS
jgi:hypothetical protein